jgi:Protein of unknown function (DUF2786)
VSSVLDRVRKLIALASSPNEHEARNAAMLAVRLIREHRLVLSAPARRISTPRATARATPPRGARRAREPAEEIRSPLGGDCVGCGGRYRRGETVWWFPSGGGMHAGCYTTWIQQKK